MPLKGYKQTEEHKLKTSLRMKGVKGFFTGKHHSEESKEKNRLKHLGISSPQKGKHIQTNTGKTHFKKGETGYWTGKKRPNMTGKKHPLYKGGYKNILFQNRQRKFNKNHNGGKHTLKEWEDLKKFYNYMCLCCKKSEPEIKLTEDHIIPLKLGGSNDIENI